MEKNREPPPHQKIENHNVSKTAEKLEKIIDVSIQNDKRFEGLKNETIQKSEENMSPLSLLSKAAEQLRLEEIIDAQNQDEFGLPCISDSQSIAIDMENPDMIHFSRQSTLKRTKENEIIQIPSDELTGKIVGTEGDENATEALNVSGQKGKNIKTFSKKRGKILFFCFSKFSFLFKSLGRPETINFKK